MRRGSIRGRQVGQLRRSARIDSTTALPQVAAPGSELADELLLIEMRLLGALKRRATQAKEDARTETAPDRKGRIVAELGKKR